MDWKIILLVSILGNIIVSDIIQRKRDDKILSQIYTIKYNYLVPMNKDIQKCIK